MSGKTAPAGVHHEDRVAVFQNQAIRRTWHEGQWWFSVVDVVGVLSETAIPRRYWSDLKRKMAQEAGSGQPYEKIVRLKLVAPDGKQRETDCANTETLFRIIQSIPSPNAEPFKLWLAQVGYERVQEIEDPELASARARELYEAKGCRPDIVLFVNGIPFAEIECKSPGIEVAQGISQTIRNQRDEYISRLFTYVQTVLAVNKNEARYATTGTPARFWSKWKEDVADAELAPLIERPLPDAIKAALFDLAFADLGVREDVAPYLVRRQVRYAESVDYRDFEPRIQKLLDTHISASEVVQLNAPVNIFDEAAFQKVVDEHGAGNDKNLGAKADMIAHATRRAINERLGEDPAFYQKFSRLIQQAIDDYRAKRLTDLEYLKRATEIKDAVVARKGDDLPPALSGDADAAAVYGLLRPFVASHLSDGEQAQTIAADAAMAIWDIFRRNRKVGYWDDLDAQRRAMNEIDDYLYDQVKGTRGIPLSTGEMDEIIEKTMQLARHRMAR